MARARLASYVALLILITCSVTAPHSPELPIRLAAAAPLEDVSLTPSPGLLLAEVVTGGASASDELIELTNAAAIPLDLGGLEVVYVTSSGATITRKASWMASLVLDPGRHLLIANSLGVYALLADATYSGGLAATGGAVALRVIGGATIDSVGWGDATNPYVEGSPAAGPPAGSSIERLPGGVAGNGVDTNDNAADFVVNPSPIPQNLAADPAPGASPSPSPSTSPMPTTTPGPTASPTSAPTASPMPTEAPSPTASPAPTATPTPAPSPTPTANPTTSPSPIPTPTPTTIPTPTPTPSPTPSAVVSIQDARALPDGTSVVIEGTLTLDLGSIDGARGGFVQDATAGIALYLDAAIAEPVPAGTRIRATGILSSRYSQRTLKTSLSEISNLGTGELPTALAAGTGLANESLEGRRLEVVGVVTEAPTDLADGLGLLIDDGTGPVRVIAGPAALGDVAPVTGSTVVARGPLGQRDSGGTGLLGYRLYAMLTGELAVVTPTPTPTPAPSPSATATPGPAAIDVSTARALPVGSRVLVRGVVVAEAGRLGTPPLLVIGDAGGGLPVKLPDDVVAPPRGSMLEVLGTIADPYGQTELRAITGGVAVLGLASVPTPLVIDPGMAGEALEGRLVTTHGTITTSATKATSGDLSFRITGPDGVELTVRADRSAGLDTGSLGTGLSATFTGVIGQRASRKGALDGYRLWLRDAADIIPAPQSSSPSPAPTPSTPAGHPVITIGAAIPMEGAHVTVEGAVTIDVSLLDATRRRAVIEDETGAIEVYLGAPVVALRVGARVRVSGTVGRAYGAPRLRADAVDVLGSTQPSVRTLHSATTETQEWQLVRVSGTIVDVHRLGARWRAELDVDGQRIPVSGLEGSGIDVSRIVEGRRATIVGIVRRPYPTATDQRFAIVPRSVADIDVASVGVPTRRPGSAPAWGSAGATAGSDPEGQGREGGQIVALDIDLVQLSAHLGQVVRVGGIVAALGPDGIDLDDGTAVAHLRFTGDAAAVLVLLQPGDVLNAIGTPELGDEVVLVVGDPAGLVLAGSTGAPAFAGAPLPTTLSAPAGDRRLALAGISSDMGVDLAPAGLGTMLMLALASLAVTVVRRHHARRGLQARIVARLAAFGASGRAGVGPMRR